MTKFSISHSDAMQLALMEGSAAELHSQFMNAPVGDTATLERVVGRTLESYARLLEILNASIEL